MCSTRFLIPHESHDGMLSREYNVSRRCIFINAKMPCKVILVGLFDTFKFNGNLNSEKWLGKYFIH